MKKRIIRITIFVMILFIYSRVSSAPLYDQATVNNKLEVYKTSVEELKSNKCDEVLTSKALVDKCNSLSLEKNNALVYMFNAKAYDENLISDDVEKVLDQNSSQCTSIFSSDIQEMINKVFVMFYIAGPILLIFFGSMDFINAIVAGDEKKRKTAMLRFVRRTIALVLLFASPVLVNVLVNTFGGSKYKSNVYSCTHTEYQQTITFTPTKFSSGNSQRKYGSSVKYSDRSGMVYGPSTGSTVVNLSGEKDRNAGQYVVVNTNYPGGIQGYQEMLVRNGICQTSTGKNGKCIQTAKSANGWGDCCAGFAQVQACGLKKGLELSHSKATMSKCNGAGGKLGCSGIWTWNKDTCFASEADYVQYVIKNIQNGVPVLTVVAFSSTKRGGRHFVSIVGFKAGSNGTSANDLLLLDSWDGRLESMGRKRQVGKKSLVRGHPCEGKSGEYWGKALNY